MLRISVPGAEFYDESKEEFVTVGDQVLQLEHSLLSVARWESKWKKPFFSREPKSPEEQLDYIRCMTVTPGVKPEVYAALTKENFEEINAYIEDPMTATTFNERDGKKPSRHVVTAEIIYYQMTQLNIPFSCEKWHLNRLMTLIRVCAIKQQPPKKMSKRDAMNQQRSLNAARHAKFDKPKIPRMPSM